MKIHSRSSNNRIAVSMVNTKDLEKVTRTGRGRDVHKARQELAKRNQ